MEQEERENLSGMDDTECYYHYWASVFDKADNKRKELLENEKPRIGHLVQPIESRSDSKHF